MKKRTLIFIVLLLCACSTTTRFKGYSGPDQGYLAASLVASATTNYDKYVIFYAKKDGTGGDFFWYVQNSLWKNLRTIRDFDNSNINGIVDVHTLPPGDYAVTFYSITDVGRNLRWEPENKFSYDFSIEKGKTTYIGEIKADGTKGKNMFGMTVVSGATFYINNQIERDRPIIRQKLGTTEIEIVERILQVKYLGG